MDTAGALPKSSAPGAPRAESAASLGVRLRRAVGLLLGGTDTDSSVGAPAATEAGGRAALVEPALLRSVFDRLPDAVLAVEGARAEGVTGLRISLLNAAGRRGLPLPAASGDRLIAAVRHPDVLAAAERSALEGAPQTLTYESGGTQPREWRVWTEPLPTTGDRVGALLVFRDETTARRLERMRVDFLANASHELRTPLASLTGFIETLRGHARDDAPARERFLGIMAGQAERMRRLVDDLLSLSRIELNEHVAPTEVCDLSAVVREAADMLGPMMSARDVRLDASGVPARLSITGDRDQLAQIVQNLLENAAKYARSRVIVACAPDVGFESPEALAASRVGSVGGATRLPLLSPDRPHERRFALLTVVDDGCGIEREHLPRLAERFYRAPGQKRSEAPGTGLGLAIVKHLVNRHRGGLAAESTAGGGAAFAVYLPMGAGVSPAESGALSSTAVTRSSPNRHESSASDVQGWSWKAP